MKNGKLQCKDIPDIRVLEFLSRQPERWHTWYAGFENSVQNGMPEGTPEKLALAKMVMLINRGLVGGCPCGCRGDFVITDKGKKLLASQA